MPALEPSEVLKRLESIDSSAVTDHLYDMGKILMEESGQRVDFLDAKAARMAGYTGAIIGLMVSTFPIWTSAIDRWAIVLVTIGIFIGMVGGAIALKTMWPAPQLLPSDSDWIELDALKDPHRLKKYYISSMHLTISSQEKVAAGKTSALKGTQFCLAVMVLSLFVGLGNAAYKVVTSAPSSRPSVGAALRVSS